MKMTAVLLSALLLPAMSALAQDASRGAKLYADTARVTGKAVAPCIGCHADTDTLRELIRNRGGRPDDPMAVARRLDAVIAGALPGAANAKAQYRNVLSATDLRDLAAYIARAKQAAFSG